MYAENSTPRFGGVLPQAEFLPKLIQKLQDSPDDVLADFESIRKHGKYLSTRFCVTHSVSLLVIDPSGVRFSVTGNVLSVKEPRSTWAKYFGSSLPVCH